MIFYTGAHHPGWLTASTIPLFLSATTLARYRSSGDRWPVRGTSGAPWAGDSGAYAALMLATDRDGHPWSADYESYGGMWLRIVDEIGCMPDFIAVQDWPCEPSVRVRTGMSVAWHQEATTDSYLQLAEGFPWLPWLPIVQGWSLPDYVRHVEAYAAAGVDLTAASRVGIGSICRRGSQRAVAAIVETLAARGLRLHAFGASVNALRLVGHLLTSSDSQAWSATARREHIRLSTCTHPGDCRNCPAYAAQYAAAATAAAGAGGVRQGALDLWGAAA